MDHQLSAVAPIDLDARCVHPVVTGCPTESVPVLAGAADLGGVAA